MSVPVSASTSALPPTQDILIPQSGAMPNHRTLYRQRSARSRGASHVIADGDPLLGGVGSGLHAMLTPTLATHSGGTILSHTGSSIAGPRIVIPLPAALAVGTALAPSGVVPTPIVGASGTAAVPTAAFPSMLIDSEWFFVQAYPVEIRQYLTTAYSFDVKPTSPEDVVEKTQELLRSTFRNLKAVGLTLEIGKGLKAIFDEVTAPHPSDKKKPKHPFNESQETKNLYYILAYVVSNLLWVQGTSLPIRNYPELTYPGVIVASFVVRMTGYYLDLSAKLKVGTTANPRPYLRAGGLKDITETSLLTQHGNLGSQQLPTLSAINSIPTITAGLKISAMFATGRSTISVNINCEKKTYAALQDAALNVPGLTPLVIEQILMKKEDSKTNLLSDKIAAARCTFYAGLIQGTILPGDDAAAAAVPKSGVKGVEPLADDDS